MNKLASIERILEINPHPNGDNIEICSILGWKVITQKGLYKAGELVIYVEIDTEFPAKPEFVSFLEPRHWRVKTIRLRGEYSQGLLLPLSLLDTVEGHVEPLEGTSVSELIDCIKYEKPFSVGPNNLKPKGNFYTDAGWSKTDEINICSHLQMLEALKGLPYYITQKADGMSTSVTYDSQKDELVVCSRNMRLYLDGDNAFLTGVGNYDLDNIMRMYPQYGIQYETVGPGIQKNPMGLKNIQIRVFNLFDKINKVYCGFDELVDFCTKTCLPMVQLVECNNSFNYTLEDLIKMASEIKYPGNLLAEGIVIRPQTPIYIGQNNVSFKCLCQKYDERN